MTPTFRVALGKRNGDPADKAMKSSSPMSEPASPERLPAVVFLLAVGTFLMCTSEYLIAGLLPEMANTFHVSLATTGLLITAFAVGMIVGAPAMALATSRMPARTTLILALVVFVIGHALAALSSDFDAVLAARVLTALVTGAFWSVASAVATAAAGPRAASKALGVMMSGVGLATVVGVPLGSWTGQQLGWRGAFWGLAVLAGLATVLMARFVPVTADQDTTSINSQMSALRSRPLWLLLTGTVFVTGGYMAAFSYISPLLTDKAGFSATAVPVVLVGFGLGSVLGANVAGHLADRRPLATLIAAAAATCLTLTAIVAMAGNPAAAVALLVLLGVVGMAVPPVATGMAVGFAAAAPTLAAGLAVAAFNAGIAVGAWIAGDALDSSLGATGPALVGAVMVAIGVIPLLALAGILRDGDRHRSAPAEAYGEASLPLLLP